MRRTLKVLSTVALIPAFYLLFVLLTPWLQRQGTGLAAPWTTSLVVGQVLAFPQIIGGIMAIFFLVWIAAGWLLRRVSGRNRRPNGTPLVGFLVSAMCVALALHPVSGPQEGPTEGRTMSVVSWNVHDELTRADLGHVVRGNPEVVVLPEASTGPLEKYLSELGKDSDYQVFATSTGSGLSPTSVLISKSLGTYQIAEGEEPTVGTLALRPADPASSNPVVLGVHTASPVPRWMDQWDSDVGSVLDDVCTPRRDDSPRPVIAAGDYNANPWHGHMATIPGRDGCTDALPASGVSRGTWPSSLAAWTRTQIDHVVVNGDMRVDDADVMPIEGPSDHVPVRATLRF